MQIVSRCLAVAATLALVASAGFAQGKPSIEDAAALGQKIFQNTAPTGMVLVVVHDDQLFFGGYGKVAYDRPDHPGIDSVVRLCSLSKIMATDLLIKLVLDKTVRLDDPLQKFAPKGYIVPERTGHGEVGHPVTLIDLATHTAGFPREIAYPANDQAHFSFPDYPFRWNWLQHASLRTEPGHAAHYSNVGFDFLGDALAAASGKSYLQLFNDRTAKPLGLKDTTLAPTEAQCSRLLQGARGEGPCTNTEASGGSGGMYSTPRDMVRFLRYLLGIAGSPAQAKEAKAVYLQPGDLKFMGGLNHAGDPTGLGLGWVMINDPASPSYIIQKTGGGAGFLTYIALNPATHTGIFVAETEGRRHVSSNLFHDANDLLLEVSGLPPMPKDETAKRPAKTADTRRPGGVDPRKSKAAAKAGPAPVNHAARIRARRAAKQAAPAKAAASRKTAAPTARKTAPKRKKK